jgi:hypothetical protein
MSERIEIATIGGQPEVVEAVQSRKLITSLGGDLQLLGGENPDFYFPKQSAIVASYLVGGDPVQPVFTLPGRSTKYQEITKTLTAQSTTQSIGTIQIFPVGGIDSIVDWWWDVQVTAMTQAADQINPFLDFSLDNISWQNVEVGQTFNGSDTFPEVKFTGCPQSHAGIVPPFVRLRIVPFAAMVGTYTLSARLRVYT